MQHKTIHMVTFTLLLAGGLNWLLIGLFGLDLVMKIASYLGSSGPMIAKVVYIAVGASAVYELIKHKSDCRTCSAGGM
jgi:uncharacterized protein